MNINPYARSIIYENIESAFKMPHKIHGKIAREVMLEKYRKLSNEPTHILETRFITNQW